MSEIENLEREIMNLSNKLAGLRRDNKPTPVKNYLFKTMDGEVSLLDLFAGKEILFVIHNMGQACRYCTLWADGINGFVSHLESQYSIVLVSKDDPLIQRQFANSRNWRFRMASHCGGEYIQEQNVYAGEKNAPGMVAYKRKGDEVFKLNATGFGPGDEFCSMWKILGMAGISEEEWTPQYNYWKRPSHAQMEDGGQNLL